MKSFLISSQKTDLAVKSCWNDLTSQLKVFIKAENKPEEERKLIN